MAAELVSGFGFWDPVWDLRMASINLMTWSIPQFSRSTMHRTSEDVHSSLK